MMNPKHCRQSFLPGAAIWLCISPLYGQLLLVNREFKNSVTPSINIKLGGKSGAAFLADRFRVGEAGEVWVLDRLRTWGEVGSAARIGDRFERVTLFGGLEAKPLAPGEFDCDCHNLVAIQTAALKKGTDDAVGPDVHISHAGASVWQLDFEHLNWSVPGGAEIQFGVEVPNRIGSVPATGWSASTVRTSAPHQIKIFDARGKLLGSHPNVSDPALGFAIQVWGHLPATIAIRPNGDFWEVTLNSGAAFDATHAERTSLRFGPNGAQPVATHSKDANLVMSFRAADTGIRPGELNACLTGRRPDGVPFEGCDLLKRPPR